MIQYYRATEKTEYALPVHSKYTKVNDIASLALEIIRENGEISRKRLIDRIEQRSAIKYEYASITLRGTIGDVMHSLSSQGLVEKLTFEQYVANGLTMRQIANCMEMMNSAGVTIRHGHSNAGEYTKQELNILRKIGNYVSAGMSKVNAIRYSIKEELGEDKLKQFNEWYKQHCSRDKKNRRAELIKRRKPPRIGINDFDIWMTLYDDAAYRRSPDGRLSHVHDSILERLARDFPKQSPAMRQYPFNLYFALSGKTPEVEVAEKLEKLMASTPVHQKFSDYERRIFEVINRSLADLSSKLEVYLGDGFRESEERIGHLAGIKGKRGPPADYKSWLAIVKARYEGSGGTLENIGQEKSVTRERIRQIESKGIRLLREQPTIQKVLSMEFWEIV